jgi:hypothetical protein
MQQTEHPGGLVVGIETDMKVYARSERPSAAFARESSHTLDELVGWMAVLAYVEGEIADSSVHVISGQELRKGPSDLCHERGEPVAARSSGALVDGIPPL